MRLNVKVDADGVQAKWVERYLDFVQKHTGRLYQLSDVTSFEFSECIVSREEHLAIMADVDSREGIVRGLGDIDGSREAITELRSFAKVRTLTSPRFSRNWMYERAMWLMDRGYAKRDIIQAADKTECPGDVLVDDKMETCAEYAVAHPRALVILFDQPWNRGVVPRGVVRAMNWPEIVDLVRLAATRSV